MRWVKVAGIGRFEQRAIIKHWSKARSAHNCFNWRFGRLSRASQIVGVVNDVPPRPPAFP